jgi:hypothetical protein
MARSPLVHYGGGAAAPSVPQPPSSNPASTHRRAR